MAECNHSYSERVDRVCGVRICYKCGHHEGLVRCFCGWSLTRPGYGAQELVEMGENIEED